MTVEEARKIIRNTRKSQYGNLAIATNIFAMDENDDQVSFLDLIDCLKRGNNYKRMTIIEEVAALTLYRRTGRKRKPGHAPYEDFVTDAGEWQRYLEEQGFLKQAVSKSPRKRSVRARASKRRTRSS